MSTIRKIERRKTGLIRPSSDHQAEQFLGDHLGSDTLLHSFGPFGKSGIKGVGVEGLKLRSEQGSEATVIRQISAGEAISGLVRVPQACKCPTLNICSFGPGELMSKRCKQMYRCYR